MGIIINLYYFLQQYFRNVIRFYNLCNFYQFVLLILEFILNLGRNILYYGILTTAVAYSIVWICQKITLYRLGVREFKHPDYPKFLFFQKLKITGWFRRKNQGKFFLDIKFIGNYMQKHYPQENKVAIFLQPMVCMVLHYGPESAKELFLRSRGVVLKSA